MPMSVVPPVVPPVLLPVVPKCTVVVPPVQWCPHPPRQHKEGGRVRHQDQQCFHLTLHSTLYFVALQKPAAAL